MIRKLTNSNLLADCVCQGQASASAELSEKEGSDDQTHRLTNSVGTNALRSETVGKSQTFLRKGKKTSTSTTTRTGNGHEMEGTTNEMRKSTESGKGLAPLDFSTGAETEMGKGNAAQEITNDMSSESIGCLNASDFSTNAQSVTGM